MEILNLSDKEIKWRYGPVLPYNIAFGSMVETTKGVYLIGGLINRDASITASKYIYFLNQTTDWIKLDQTLNVASINHASILIEDHLVECRS